LVYTFVEEVEASLGVAEVCTEASSVASVEEEVCTEA
jgi:hypothetical protein